MKNVRIEGTAGHPRAAVLGEWAYLRNYISMEKRRPATSYLWAGYTLTILRKEAEPQMGLWHAEPLEPRGGG